MSLPRVRAWMEANGVASACFTRPVSVGYLSGFHTEPHERLMALVIKPGSAQLLVPELERENAQAHARGAEVVSWRDGDDPVAALAQLVPRGSRLAVEKAAMSLRLADELRAHVAVPEFLDVGGELARLRAVKSPAELLALATAAKLTDAVLAHVLEQLGEGQTELEVAALVSQAITQAGSSPAFDSAIQSGANSALPHLKPTERRLQAGDLVLLDLGATSDRYRADITRVVVLGEPRERQAEVHSLVLEARDRAVAAVRAGATAGEIDAAARGVIGRGGLGGNFIHRTGHGLGLEAHEDPSLSPGSDLVLEAGMVITIEPGVYIPGWGGIRIEDDVVVEDDGARVLTQAPRELSAITT